MGYKKKKARGKITQAFFIKGENLVINIIDDLYSIVKSCFTEFSTFLWFFGVFLTEKCRHSRVFRANSRFSLQSFVEWFDTFVYLFIIIVPLFSTSKQKTSIINTIRDIVQKNYMRAIKNGNILFVDILVFLINYLKIYSAFLG